MKNKTFSLLMLSLFMLTIGYSALVMMPVQQAEAVLVNPCSDPKYCNDHPEVCRYNTLRYTPGKNELSRREKLERQQLVAAYAGARNQGLPQGPLTQAQGETKLRRAASIGLSLLMLFGGLMAVATLVRALIASLIGAHKPRRKSANGLLALGHALSMRMGMVATLSIGLAVVLAMLTSVEKPDMTITARAAMKSSFTSAVASQFQSTITFGGTGTTQIGGTAIDPAGNLYVTGGFTGNIVFNTQPQTTLTSTDDHDLFVAKFDSSGNPLWARAANGVDAGAVDPLPPGLSLDGGLSLAVDALGNAYVGGGFVTTLVFKDAGNATVATLGDTNDDINFELFVAKYDSNGNLIWARGGNSGAGDDPEAGEDLDAGSNGITEIVVDGAGNPYVAGTVGGTSFLGEPVPGVGKSDLVLSRLDPATGDPVWVYADGSVDNDGILGLSRDNASNLYVIGVIDDEVTFDTLSGPVTIANPGGLDSFVAKFNQNGQIIWVNPIGGDFFILGAHLAADGDGNSYLTGSFQGIATFGSISVTEPSGDSNGFLVKYDPAGNVIWVRTFGDPDFAEGNRVALDGAGNPYVTGTLGSQSTFGAETPSPQTITSQEGQDQFVAKYAASGNFQFAKAIPATGSASEFSASEAVPVEINPMRLIYDGVTESMRLSGDFSGTLTLDDITLNSGSDRDGFVARLAAEINDAPAVVNDPLGSVAEDSGQRTIPFATLLVNDSKGPPNESSQTLTVKTVNNPVGGTVSILGNNVLFTPTADHSGPAGFDYTVEDNGTTGGSPDPKTSAPGTASFTITEINDTPVPVNDTLGNVVEDSGQRTIPFATLIGNDSKGPANEGSQTLTVKTVSNPVGGTVSILGNNVLFTPTADHSGPAGFDYTVEDNGTTGGSPDPKTSAPGTASFTITEINDTPVPVNDTLSNVGEDSGTRSIPFATLTGNDSKGPANENGQTLTVITTSSVVGGTVFLVPGFVVFTPTDNYSGPASFNYVVQDNGTTNGVADPKTSGSGAVQFNITEVNDAPTAVNDSLPKVAEDSGERTIAFADLTGNDLKGPANESGQTLIVTTVNNPIGVTVSIVAGTVRITPLPDYNGTASFQYSIRDNGTTSGFGDEKTGGPAMAQFNITEVNDAPTANNETLANAAEDSGERTIPFTTLTTNDSKGSANESGQTLIVKTVSNGVGGTVNILGGDVIFTPAADFNGPASFAYTVEDNGTSNGAADPKTSAAATASFNISAVADTPSVTSATTNANTQTTSGLVISRNPADGGEVTHFKITGITGGALFKNNGATTINNGDFITVAEGNAGLKFTPGATNGSFTVQSSLSGTDAGLGGGTATAAITVNPAGGVIRFSTDNYSVAEGAGSRTITVERTGDTSQAVTVDYASSDHSNPADSIPCTAPGAGFASSRCDFTTAIGTLRFAAGETSKSFNVLISQDNYVEGTEIIELNLSNPTGGAVFGVPSTAFLGITDDATEPATNPIDTSSEFVRSQYHDFLNREPDALGLSFWTDNIEKCTDPARRPAGLTVEQCVDKQRESTAVAFFSSPEFQMTGGFVYRLYKGSLTGAPNYDGGLPGSSAGRFPTSLEFMRDVSQVSEGILVNNQISGAVVEANRNRLAAEFVQRPEFVAKYGGLNNTLYVLELFNTTGIVATTGEKQTLIDGLTNGIETRASVLRRVVDGTVVLAEGNVQFTTTYGQAFYNQEFRRVFVFMEYVGYMRRNPDTAGYVFWLGKLNFYGGDPFQAEMVRSFILSPEYRNRFGQP